MTKTKRYSLRISEETWQMIRKLAFDRMVSMNQIIEECINAGLKLERSPALFCDKNIRGKND